MGFYCNYKRMERINNIRGEQMKIIIEVENDINLVEIEKKQLKAFIRRLGFKVLDIYEVEG